ncbi:MAG: DNA double-strand break repair nuclease NurA [Thermomicrobium sp.]|nr:DNA double-strand break repair nuclease NurA [Thermomicrobium sp.]
MSVRSARHLFADLPAALVDELLGRAPALSKAVVEQLSERRSQRERLRERLRALDLLGTVDRLPPVPIPTSCGVDGSVVVERLLAHDLLVAGTLAVEGLTPPSEQRFWPEPRHQVWVELERHSDANDVVARGVMAALEVELAAQAPHELVFLDGSLATPLIAFDQALRALAELAESTPSSRFFLARLPDWLAALHRLLEPDEQPGCRVGVPKYTTRRDIAELLEIGDPVDDRALLIVLLEPGEFTRPIPLRRAHRPHSFGFALLPAETRTRVADLVPRLFGFTDALRVVYVRPHRWLPALRVELHEAVASDDSRSAAVLAAVMHQCAGGNLVEPFPLFLADRMVRHLRRATRALRHTVRETVAREYPDFDHVFLALESYRSEVYRTP